MVNINFKLKKMKEILDKVNKIAEVLNSKHGVPNLEWLQNNVNVLRSLVIKNCNITDVSNWVACEDKLPDHLQTVWLANAEKQWVCLGCLVDTNEGWHWAESNGVIYVEDGVIVSECESDDLDVTHWCELPKPPCC